jgi:hypothetical protein
MLGNEKLLPGLLYCIWKPKRLAFAVPVSAVILMTACMRFWAIKDDKFQSLYHFTVGKAAGR